MAALFLVLAPNAAYSCGPFFDDAQFVYTLHPDLPLKFWANSKLGVIQPTFARSYLVSAYRDISGKPLTPFEQNAMSDLWDLRLTGRTDYDDSSQKWLEARNKIPGVKKIDFLSTDRAVTKSADDVYNTYPNCTGDAFKSAITSLQTHVTKSGASSQAVKDWVANQDLVFCHCQGPSYSDQNKKYDPEPAFPAPAPAGADALTKAERAYQIAAAHFYAQDFDLAAKEFDEIARDESSPYKSMAPYLAARCMIRKGVLPKVNDQQALANALTRLKAIEADTKESQENRQAATKLISYVSIRHATDASFEDIAKKISVPATQGNFQQEVTDYTILLDRYLGIDSSDDSTAKVDIAKVPKAVMDDMTEWVLTISSQEPAGKTLALSKWNQSKSTLWMVPAIMHAKGADPAAQGLIDAALAVSTSQPAYNHVRYHAARLLIEKKENAKALKVITETLAIKGLPPSTVNLLTDRKAAISASIADYWKDVIRIPAGDVAGYDSQELPSELDPVESLKTWYVSKPAFNPATANLLNTFVPTSELVKAPWSTWPVPQKRDFLQALWTRSVLLNDDKTTDQLTPLLAAQNPVLTKVLTEYKGTTDPDQKRFLRTYIFVSNPAMRPYITPGIGRTTAFNKIDDFQDNWWSTTIPAASKNGDDDSDKPVKVKPAFMNTAQLAQAASEEKKLEALGGGPSYILTELIAYANKPGTKDNRLPEALYHAIRSPKFGSQDKNTTNLSKTAFNILHKKYPTNPWTKKTQFWY